MNCLLDAVVPLVMVVKWYLRDVLQETIRSTGVALILDTLLNPIIF